MQHDPARDHRMENVARSGTVVHLLARLADGLQVWWVMNAGLGVCMTMEFEIRQQVKTVRRRWLELVTKSGNERIMRSDYERLAASYPDEYFELVRIETSEECLAFTPKHEQTPNVKFSGERSDSAGM